VNQSGASCSTFFTDLVLAHAYSALELVHRLELSPGRLTLSRSGSLASRSPSHVHSHRRGHPKTNWRTSLTLHPTLRTSIAPSTVPPGMYAELLKARVVQNPRKGSNSSALIDAKNNSWLFPLKSLHWAVSTHPRHTHEGQLVPQQTQADGYGSKRPNGIPSSSNCFARHRPRRRGPVQIVIASTILRVTSPSRNQELWRFGTTQHTHMSYPLFANAYTE
jgi:hypothetical protein